MAESSSLGEKAHLLEGPPEVHFLTPVAVGDPAKGAL